MATAIEYALMAGRAYLTNRSQINQFPIPDGWAEFFHAPDSATASAFPVTSGFEAVSFKRGAGTNTEIVISELKGSASHYFWSHHATPSAH